MVENVVGRSKKKVEKFENFVNFGVSLTFFVVIDIGCPRPKRVSTVIPNTTLLVDSRETNGEKCRPASRGLEFLSRVYTRRKSSAWCNNKPSLRSGIINIINTRTMPAGHGGAEGHRNTLGNTTEPSDRSPGHHPEAVFATS